MLDTMLVFAMILVFGFLFLLIKKRRKPKNVARLQDFKRKRKNRQLTQRSAKPHSGTSGAKCSHCRKQDKRITFYADDSGTVIGLCPVCKPIAERRDLMPL